MSIGGGDGGSFDEEDFAAQLAASDGEDVAMLEDFPSSVVPEVQRMRQTPMEEDEWPRLAAEFRRRYVETHPHAKDLEIETAVDDEYAAQNVAARTDSGRIRKVRGFLLGRSVSILIRRMGRWLGVQPLLQVPRRRRRLSGNLRCRVRRRRRARRLNGRRRHSREPGARLLRHRRSPHLLQKARRVRSRRQGPWLEARRHRKLRVVEWLSGGSERRGWSVPSPIPRRC